MTQVFAKSGCMKKKRSNETPKRPTKDASATFLCTEQEKIGYEQAAIEADLSMSDWIRKTLRAALEQQRQLK